jgi:hypothetical protein
MHGETHLSGIHAPHQTLNRNSRFSGRRSIRAYALACRRSGPGDGPVTQRAAYAASSVAAQPLAKIHRQPPVNLQPLSGESFIHYGSPLVLCRSTIIQSKRNKAFKSTLSILKLISQEADCDEN